MTEPPSGAPPPTAAELRGHGVLTSVRSREEICARYRAEFPDEQQRYGDVGMAWCVHDNQYILQWAVTEVERLWRLRASGRLAGRCARGARLPARPARPRPRDRRGCARGERRARPGRGGVGRRAARELPLTEGVEGLGIRGVVACEARPGERRALRPSGIAQPSFGAACSQETRGLYSRRRHAGCAARSRRAGRSASGRCRCGPSARRSAGP